ncbi:MAG TPA: hypothetical protein VGJ57_01120 [Nitrospirales bacterium]
MYTLLVGILLVALSGCATETWVPPADKSELQAKRDTAECEKYVARTSETDVSKCMEKLGYKKQPH